MLMVMLVLTLAIFSKDERTAINRTLEVSDGSIVQYHGC